MNMVMMVDDGWYEGDDGYLTKLMVEADAREALDF